MLYEELLAWSSCGLRLGLALGVGARPWFVLGVELTVLDLGTCGLVNIPDDNIAGC